MTKNPTYLESCAPLYNHVNLPITITRAMQKGDTDTTKAQLTQHVVQQKNC
jgi:hypothetical protein